MADALLSAPPPTSDGFPIDRAHFVALWLESLLYGAFAVLYAICLWTLVNKEKVGRRVVSRPMVFTATALFVVATAHIIVGLVRGLQATFGGDAAAQFIHLRDPMFITQTALYAVQTTVSDAFLVYRCWIIWSQNYYMAFFPGLLVLGNTATGIGTIHKFVTSPQDDTIFDPELVPWLTWYLSLSVATNGVATALIAIRIWQTRSKVAHAFSFGFDVWAAVIILVESGAIYSISLIVLISTYLTKTTSQFIVLYCVTPIIGIVFTTIIIRVALGVSAGERSRGEHSSHNHSHSLSTARRHQNYTAGSSTRLSIVAPFASTPPPFRPDVRHTLNLNHSGAQFTVVEPKAYGNDISDGESGHSRYGGGHAV